MIGKKMRLAKKKSRKVYAPIEAVMVGRTCTTKKLKSPV